MTDAPDATLLVRGTALPLPVDVRDDRLRYVMTATVGRPARLRPGLYALEVPLPGRQPFRTVVTATSEGTTEIDLPEPAPVTGPAKRPFRRRTWTLEVISPGPGTLHVHPTGDDDLLLDVRGRPSFLIVTHHRWGRPTESVAVALPHGSEWAVLSRDGRRVLPGRPGRDDPARAATQLIEQGRLEEAGHLLAALDAGDDTSLVLRGFLALHQQRPFRALGIDDLTVMLHLPGADPSSPFAAWDSDGLALAAALYLRQDEPARAAAAFTASVLKGPPCLSWAAAALFEVMRDNTERPEVEPRRLAALTRLVRHADLSRLHLTIPGLPRDTLLRLLADAWGLTGPRPVPLPGRQNLLARWLIAEVRPMAGPAVLRRTMARTRRTEILVSLAAELAAGAVRALSELLRRLFDRR
ncbi:hypothetical protein [Nucisporomicrobium flavum]|uniref:hypothetical protein n=1 Tax=Nucisporomicrobium flavum TaxID=2785915 RepID=UPI0018F286E2|nr:hypothetical protein [Nucisporomicrobium flavum]